MKRICSGLLACAMLLAFSACKGNGAPQESIDFDGLYINESILNWVYPDGVVPKDEIAKFRYLALDADKMDAQSFKELHAFDKVSWLDLNSRVNMSGRSSFLSELDRAYRDTPLPNLSTLFLSTNRSVDLQNCSELLAQVQDGINIIVDIDLESPREIRLPSSSQTIQCTGLTLSADTVSQLQWLEKCPKLQSLAIFTTRSHNRDGGDDMPVVDAKSISSMPLMSLRLHGVKITNEAELSKLKSLRSLTLNQVDIQDMHWVLDLPNLESIELNWVTADTRFIEDREG